MGLMSGSAPEVVIAEDERNVWSPGIQARSKTPANCRPCRRIRWIDRASRVRVREKTAPKPLTPAAVALPEPGMEE